MINPLNTRGIKETAADRNEAKGYGTTLTEEKAKC